jgi:hypothetical protein
MLFQEGSQEISTEEGNIPTPLIDSVIKSLSGKKKRLSWKITQVRSF